MKVSALTLKSPNSTLSLIAQYLPSLHKDHCQVLDREYTIDELARVTETTTRNIRAYQERGILPPPRLRGRKGIYSDAHYSRIRLIADLLGRGYTLSTINDLLKALEQGLELSEFVGIETALTSPWTDEEPVVIPVKELMGMFNNKISFDSIEKAQELDIFRFDENKEKVHVRSMKTIKAASELASTGIPFQDLLNIVKMLRQNVECVANELVKLVATHVLQKYNDDSALPIEDLPQLADLIWRLRPLAEMAMHAELARAMEKAANHILGDKLEQMIKQLDV